MTNIDKFITDEQDPKIVEKLISKLVDMLTGGEELLYMAVQKKPVSIASESIAVTNKRLIFCTPGNLGFTTNFNIFLWKDIKEVSFKEEFLGSKFTSVPLMGENITVDYVPKIQARKLYQIANEQLEKQSKFVQQQEADKERVAMQNAQSASAPSYNNPVAEDETTQKLQKLKTLFEKNLITQEEYETKKADILSQL